MGVLVSLIRSIMGDTGDSEQRHPIKHISLRSASSDPSPCQACLDCCPICFDFVAQAPHECCALWRRSQSSQAKIEGWSWYMQFRFEPVLLSDTAASTCSSCGLLQKSIKPYEGVWEKKCTGALFVMSRTLVIQLLEVASAILILELDIKQNGITPHYQTRQSHSISEDPVSDNNLQRIQKWISECSENHELCSRNIRAKLPTRVIDVGPEDGSKDSFLFEPKDTERAAHFLTLSHCWGGSQPLTTTKATLKARKNGITWAELPRTFQDAILLTRGLGHRYLWIDSLCIIQDDGSDWEREGSKMASIYGASLLTITASSAANSLDGFLRKRSIHNFQVTRENGNSMNVQVRRPASHLGYHFDFAAAEMFPFSVEGGNSPLYTRAWCFQERILAPRVIHFLSHEAVFECMTKCFCECGVADTFDSKRLLKPIYAHQFELLDRNKSDSTSHFQSWKNLVQTYSSRQLTFQKDRLPALSGTAHKMMQSGTYTYIAGLWKESLADGLAWHRTGTIDALLASSGSRPVEYLAPTFSWAAVTGEVTWTGRGEEQMIQVLDVQCQPSTPDICGQVKSSYIKIRGRLVPCQIINKRKSGSFQLQQLDIGGWPYLDAIEDADYSSETNAYCLELFTSTPTEPVPDAYKPMWSTALLLTSRIASGSYAEKACESVKANTMQAELNDLIRVSWYTRIGYVNRLSPDVFANQPESDILVL